MLLRCHLHASTDLVAWTDGQSLRGRWSHLQMPTQGNGRFADCLTRGCPYSGDCPPIAHQGTLIKAERERHVLPLGVINE
jgi:hypothetical protein